MIIIVTNVDIAASGQFHWAEIGSFTWCSCLLAWWVASNWIIGYLDAATNPKVTAIFVAASSMPLLTADKV